MTACFATMESSDDSSHIFVFLYFLYYRLRVDDVGRPANVSLILGVSYKFHGHVYGS